MNILHDDFFERVVKVGECWEWAGSVDPKTGYGKVYAPGIGNRKVPAERAHRVAYELQLGQIPVGLNVLHSCDNRRCVRGKHLRAGTDRDNIADAVSRRRWASTTKTHCPNGHEYTGTNLYSRSNGHRGCRYCRNEATRRYRAKKQGV